ncbi:kinase-like domain-containing protein [Tribonema minus]|uniref:Kinase-like domain-containing protein n=1 Tax=Tribonema minus TaxID=303371 RepID=A0A835YWS5_9STRA|nr:kinase-like domain-containing protein [Tribonema minus]
MRRWCLSTLGWPLPSRSNLCLAHRRGRTIVRSCIKKAEREANTQSWFDYYGTVGQGSFGMVELVHQRHKQASECTGGTTFAVKVCRKGTTRRQLEICRREARIMKSIPPHPFVVGLSHCVEDDGNIYMALEYCMGGDLFTHLGELGTLPERAARHLVAELTLALAHLHADGIMHRDVKPENVLLDARGHARLADFGLATSNITRADGGAMSICGSPGYIAPEVLAGRGYGLAADWWQLGMLLLEVTTGQLPWAGATLGDVSRAFRSVPLDLPAYLSSDATDFLILALCPHPGMRIGSLGADEVKRHAFFSGVRWGRVARKEVPPPFNPSSPSYHGGPFTPCCGHGAEAAQAHAAGEAPRCRVEVSHDEDGAIVMETVPVPQAAEGAAPPRPAGAAAELCEGVGRERGSSARSGGAGGSLRGGSGRARGSGRVWFQ